MKVYQLINDKGNGATNQVVVEKDGKIYFQSYNTIIAVKERFNNEKVFLSESWDRSKTTRKHLYIFLRDEGMSIYKREDILKGIKNGKFEVVEEIKYSYL